MSGRREVDVEELLARWRDERMRGAREPRDDSRDHPDARLVWSFSAGELNETDRRTIVDHLKTCTTCMDELARADLCLDSSAEDSVGLDERRRLAASVVASVRARARENPSDGADEPDRREASVSPARSHRRRWLVLAGAATLAAALMLLILRPFDGPTDERWSVCFQVDDTRGGAEATETLNVIQLDVEWTIQSDVDAALWLLFRNEDDAIEFAPVIWENAERDATTRSAKRVYAAKGSSAVFLLRWKTGRTPSAEELQVRRGEIERNTSASTLDAAVFERVASELALHLDCAVEWKAKTP